MNRRLISVVVLGIAFLIYLILPQKSQTLFINRITPRQQAEATVLITDLEGSRGGSGVVLNSSEIGSQILTNAHVCEILGRGGKIFTDDAGVHMPLSYRQSKLFDLCLINVLDDLKINTALATRAPRDYDELTVSGHPSLYATVIEKGYFSKKVLIQVFTGLRVCEEDEKTSFFCLVFGGVPVIRTFEARLITAVIKPGSSGSAVYDAQGGLAGLVFAGSGELDYGYIVPYEAIVWFLGQEAGEFTVPVNVDTTPGGQSLKKAYRWVKRHRAVSATVLPF